jgi:parallel beta-helix repeat protein
MKKLFSTILLILLLTSAVILVSNIQPAKAIGTIYIRADGSIDPPTAPIQRDGDVYTIADNINSDADGIVIERDNMTVDGAGYTLQGTGSGAGISLSERSYVTIQNMTIRGFSRGISVSSSSCINISRNNITNNGWQGILLSNARANSMIGNNITANGECGISLAISSNNFLRDNTVAGSNYNFGVYGSNDLFHFMNDVDASNTVDGKPIFYLVNQHNLSIDPQTYLNIGYLAVVNSTYIKVQHLNMKNNSEGVLFAYTQNSLVQNVTATNNVCGISLCSSLNNSITGNNLTANIRGVELSFDSSYNNITGNSITANAMGAYASLGGIFVRSCPSNRITGNNIANNRVGIEISGQASAYNSIIGNSLTDNEWGVYLDYTSNNSVTENTFVNNGLYVWVATGNVVSENLVNSKPLIYLEGISDYIVEDAGQVILVNCSGILVENLELSNATSGVQLCETNNTKIVGNNVTANNLPGICLFQSSNNSITGNNVTANNHDGIWFSYSSDNNSVVGNSITANKRRGIGLDYSSNNNSIVGNNITANGECGIGLDYSSNDNTIVGNNLTANNWAGIYICFSSSNNRIFHNNFKGNRYCQAYVQDFYGNSWDDGYPSGGNYWSDYTGVDMFSGPYQNEAGSDHIGDTSYIIDANNLDRYPLMSSWPLDVAPPSIAAPSVSPPTPISVDTVTVSVAMTDSQSGVKSGTLYYTVDNWVSVNISRAMTYNTISALWTATIPAQAYGTTVRFYVTACDNAGNIGKNDNNGQYFTYTVADLSLPSISPISPAQGTALPYQNVAFSVFAQDLESGINRAELYNDGQLKGNMIQAGGGIYTLTVTGLISGSHTWYAKAYNNAGLTTTSSSRTLIIDITPPSISTPILNPSNPTPTDTVIVSATITDVDSGVKNATIYYRVNGGSWQTSTMTNPSGNTWRGTIPAQTSGSTIDFYVVAYDNAGNRAVNDNQGNYFRYTVAYLYDVPAGTSTVDGLATSDTKVIITTTSPGQIRITEYPVNPGGSIPSGLTTLKYVLIETTIAPSQIVWPIEIRIYYKQEEIIVANIQESTLRIYYWNGNSWVLEPDSGVVTPSDVPGYSGYVWSKINHLSSFSAMGSLKGPPIPVGGEWIPIDKFQLLAPWITLASLTIAVTVSFVYVKHRKKQQD